jgi:site-specific DNA recombinase
VEYARISRGLQARIDECEERAADAGIPPVLRGRIGKEAPQRWAELGDDLAVKREIIRTVADIKLLRAGKGTRQPFGRHRLEWHWKFGPQSDTPGTDASGTGSAAV